MATSGNGENLGRKLLKMKEELEGQKSRRSELQGELKSLMKQLKQEFKIDSVEQAEKQIEKEEKELSKMEGSIIEQIEEIENLMEGKEE